MKYTERQLDCIKELINIGVGQASGALNDLLDTHIVLEVPSVEIYSLSDIKSGKLLSISEEELATVTLAFEGHFSGAASLIFPKPSAAKLVSILLGEMEIDNSTTDLDSISIGTVTEVGNIVLNGVMGSISNILEQNLKYKIPSYNENSLTQLLERQSCTEEEQALLIAQANFKAKTQNICGNVVIMFNLGSFDSLLNTLNEMTGINL